MARLRDEYDNMREALGFALDRGDVVTTSDLLTGLWFFWLISGRAGEGAAWVRRYLALPRQNTPPFERFTGDDGASEILRFTGDPETATQLKIELVATGLARPDAVVNGVALGGSIAGTLSDLAWMELNAGRIESAQSYADQALALRRESGRARGIAHAMLAVAGIAFRQGDYGRARDVFVAAAALYESAEIDTDWAECCVNVAQCELLLGHHQRATASLRDAFPAVSVLSDGIMDVVALRVAGMIAADSGQAATCVAIFGAADRMLRDSDVRQFDDHEETVHRAFLDRARAAIGEAAFAEASEQGRAATRDEIMAVAFAALA
jgi:tetratricopeptide (TPR) repeat protein